MEWERLTHVEHILKRPDSYIGSVIPDVVDTWALREGSFERAQVTIAPGLVKIFDEILVNAIDQHTLHPKKVTRIDVTVTEHCVVSVKNNGDGIPVQMHEKEKMWLPELIFGHLLTSSNYNDAKERITGGRNGYGAKLTNVFSKEFIVRVISGGKRYVQKWTNNMSQVSVPDIKEVKGAGGVEVIFEPDWSKFGGRQLDAFRTVITRRVWDAAAWCTKAHVYLNGERIQVDSLDAYAKMHVKGPTVPLGQDIVIAHSDTGKFEHVSYVNGIATTQGGTHVDRFVNQLIAALPVKEVRPAQIKASLFVFMRATRDRPTFSSQTKTECTSKDSTEYTFKPASVKAVMACGIADDMAVLQMAKNEKELRKTDGAKKSKIVGIPKLDDANWAGTHRSHECTLIVTEGDSAKTLAVAGLSVVGRNAYGVFPLRGKPRNVRDASVKQLTENQEFSDLKKILGLRHGHTYTSLKELRYGRLMIMTDADLDGSHIKGLVLNMIHHFWPELIRLGFVVAMVTPVIKAGRDWFFTEAAYAASGNRSNQVKYYKGLGTSTSSEAKEYFKMIERLTVRFENDESMDESMTLAFAKSMADMRKEWLVKHMAESPEGVPYGNVRSLPVSEFVYRDLANFSAEDIHRSIPHLMDGLKPSQRKVIYACLKKKLTSDMKVAQLAGYVAEHTAYHHGESSLQGTIVGLAQNFVGSNNINLLEPSGQFGTRLMGGKDCASARYIFTRLSPMTRKIFDERDDPVLKYVSEDGQQVEPEWYAPIVPMVLVNGAEGIGTGFSSYVPPYRLEDIKANILRIIEEKPLVPMKPWFNGFTGTVTKKGEHTWVLSSVVTREGSAWRVTDLPPGKWIQDYKEQLDDLMEKGVVSKYENYSTETKPDFKVWCENEPEVTKTIHTSNMYLLTPKGIKKYNSPEEILIDYVDIRSRLYARRKAHILKTLRARIEQMTEKMKFISAVIDGRLVVFKREMAAIENDMASMGFSKELLNTKTYEYTRDEVQKLVHNISHLENEIRTVEQSSVADLWKQNLVEL